VALPPNGTYNYIILTL